MAAKRNASAANEAPAEARMNRAVAALYEPGSTFKLITLAAAFDQGITRPEDVFDCENGAVYVAGPASATLNRFACCESWTKLRNPATTRRLPTEECSTNRTSCWN